MSKTIVIPELGNHPVWVYINGVKYGPYKVGESASVPDEVAAMLEELAKERRKSVPPDPDAAPVSAGEVKAMIEVATAPVTLDLSDEGSGITWDDEAGEYVGDESIDWSPLIESVKAGKVWFYGEDNGGSGGEHCAYWSDETNRITGERSFFFTGVKDDTFGVRLPIPSEEEEGEIEAPLIPLPVTPGGLVSLKLPTVSSGE